VAGAALRDGQTGRTLEARARFVVNAAGPWADAVAGPAGARPATPLLRARNLVLRRPLGVPLAVGARSGGRFLFVVPWGDRSIVGTSYEPRDAPPSDPLAFLDEAASAFPWARIERSQLALVHEGLVPGDTGEGGPWTRSRVVEHAAGNGAGLVSLLAAKYTTARGVAERAVDLAFERLGRPRVACRTAVTPLPKARPLEGPLAERARAAVRDEMALSLADAVLRRLDLGAAGAPPAAELAVVSGTMARELGWDAARAEAERAALAAFYAARGAFTLE
jgi:glycerol-3-phosphate dehydrogenase